MIRFCSRLVYSGGEWAKCRARFTLAELRRSEEASSRPESTFNGEWCPACEEDAWQDYLSMPVF